MAEGIRKPPFFARVWPSIARREPKALRRLRVENLAGLAGRVLEVGAGTGTNFPLYPRGVERVVAVEPEPSLRALAEQAAKEAPVPVTVRGGRFEDLSQLAQEGFDAVVSSLVLCSVPDAGRALAQAIAVLRPGGELRFVEHVGVSGAAGALQQALDATFWPALFGNCHTHRDILGAVRRAGFAVDWERLVRVSPAWLPNPTAWIAVGRALKPA